jgi:hypothetical protein
VPLWQIILRGQLLVEMSGTRAEVDTVAYDVARENGGRENVEVIRVAYKNSKGS